MGLLFPVEDQVDAAAALWNINFFAVQENICIFVLLKNISEMRFDFDIQLNSFYKYDNIKDIHSDLCYPNVCTLTDAGVLYVPHTGVDSMLSDFLNKFAEKMDLNRDSNDSYFALRGFSSFYDHYCEQTVYPVYIVARDKSYMADAAAWRADEYVYRRIQGRFIAKTCYMYKEVNEYQYNTADTTMTPYISDEQFDRDCMVKFDMYRFRDSSGKDIFNTILDFSAIQQLLKYGTYDTNAAVCSLFSTEVEAAEFAVKASDDYQQYGDYKVQQAYSERYHKCEWKFTDKENRICRLCTSQFCIDRMQTNPYVNSALQNSNMYDFIRSTGKPAWEFFTKEKHNI